MTTRAAETFYFNDNLLHPLWDIKESLKSYEGMPGAKENKYLRRAAKDIENAMDAIAAARDIKNEKHARYEKIRGMAMTSRKEDADGNDV